MSFILDKNKKTVLTYVVPNDNGLQLTGDISIGSATAQNQLIIDAGINFKFMRITESGTNYDMTENDYAIEIVNDSYNTITLPNAENIGGRTYIISRGSNNDNLVLRTRAGDLIDGRDEIKLRTKDVRIKVMSNNINKWYVI